MDYFSTLSLLCKYYMYIRLKKSILLLYISRIPCRRNSWRQSKRKLAVYWNCSILGHFQVEHHDFIEQYLLHIKNIWQLELNGLCKKIRFMLICVFFSLASLVKKQQTNFSPQSFNLENSFFVAHYMSKIYWQKRWYLFNY